MAREKEQQPLGVASLWEVLTGKKKGYDLPVWMHPRVGKEAEQFREIAYGDMPKVKKVETKTSPKPEGITNIFTALMGAKKRAIAAPTKNRRNK